MRIFGMVLAAVVAVSGGPVPAADLALVIDQQDHRRLPDLPRDRRMASISATLDRGGFEITSLENATLNELRAAAFAFDTEAQGQATHMVVLLRGHLIHDRSGTWLLGQEVATPDRFDLGSKALPLHLLTDALRPAAGRAVLAVVDDTRPLENLSDVQPGLDDVALPQGVTLLRGSSAEIETSLNALLTEGAATSGLRGLRGGAEVSGFISSTVAFTSKPTETASSANNDMGEIAYWSAVRDIGTVDALNAYLRRYPKGLFAAEARAQIQTKENNREAQIRNAETALGLNRDQRRKIQRDLALLGYDPRGADGVFGPATRRAIAAWQVDQNLDNHGYLDRDQLSLLQEFARRRAAVLEEEARQRRQIEDARDRAYWQDTGSRGTEDGYRRYLSSFPDGIFSDIARNGLAEIEAERRAELGARERGAWELAQEDNTVESYTWFLEQFPNGEFADVARARIEDLERNSAEAEAARRFSGTENAVAGSTAARLLIERRLTDFKLKPGPIDGEFTSETRRAIRRFQKARGLEVTGYVNQPTMVQLLLGR